MWPLSVIFPGWSSCSRLWNLAGYRGKNKSTKSKKIAARIGIYTVQKLFIKWQTFDSLYTSVEISYSRAGLQHQFIRTLVCNFRYSVARINTSLLAITLHSSVKTTTIVYNDTKHSVPFMKLQSGSTGI